MSINVISINMKFVFEDSPGYYLNRTATVMRSSLHRAIQKQYPEITVDYWVILNRLWKQDGIIQNELALTTGKDNASITRILDGMQKKGLIERHASKNDRRAFNICLTDKAKSLEKPLKEIAVNNTEIGLQSLDEKDIAILKNILDKIFHNYL